MGAYWDRDRLTEEWLARGLSRRELTRLLGAGAGGAAIAALLAACGGTTATPTAAPVAQPTAATAPTAAAAATTAPTTAAAAPTTAPPAATAAPTAAAQTGGQISYHWPKPTTFNPLFMTSGAAQGVGRLLFGALVKINDRLEPVPDIAEKVDISPDARTFTFTLQRGLKFTDGTPLTAKDVIFTIERGVDKRTASYYRGRLLALVGAPEYGDQKADKISGLEAPDDYTVKMTLTDPNATWLQTMSGFAGLAILPSHILKDVAPDQLQQHPFSLNPAPSAGVFQFVKYETDQFLEIKRNEGYGGKVKARLDRIFHKILTPDIALAQLDRGEIDLMIVPVSEVERVRRNPNLTVVSVPSPSVSFLTLDGARPYLKDKRIRQAMHHAIDREAIVREIYKGEATVVNQTIIGPDWMGVPEVNAYKFDPTKARQLLRDAGWDPNRKLETIYTAGSKEQDAYAPIVQQQFRDIGIQLELRVVESAEYVRKLVQAHEYEIAFGGGGIFRQDPNVSAQYFETINFTPAGGNYARFSNPRVDELFKAGRATPDPAQRKRIYTELATILNEEAPWVFLWSPNSIFAFNKRFVGFKPPSYSTHEVWNAEEWSVAR